MTTSSPPPQPEIPIPKSKNVEARMFQAYANSMVDHYPFSPVNVIFRIAEQFFRP
jgi:hypothetical protein